MEFLTTAVQSTVVLFAQSGFIYLRTINVKFISSEKIQMATISGLALGISGLLSMAIGVNAIIEKEFLPLICYLIGGAIGTYAAMKKKNIYTNQKLSNNKN